MTDRMLRVDDVQAMTGLSRSGIYALMRDSDFPEPLRLARKAVRWRESEVSAWLDARPRATGTVGAAP